MALSEVASVSQIANPDPEGLLALNAKPGKVPQPVVLAPKVQPKTRTTSLPAADPLPPAEKTPMATAAAIAVTASSAPPESVPEVPAAPPATGVDALLTVDALAAGRSEAAAAAAAITSPAPRESQAPTLFEFNPDPEGLLRLNAKVPASEPEVPLTSRDDVAGVVIDPETAPTGTEALDRASGGAVALEFKLAGLKNAIVAAILDGQTEEQMASLYQAFGETATAWTSALKHELQVASALGSHPAVIKAESIGAHAERVQDRLESALDLPRGLSLEDLGLEIGDATQSVMAESPSKTKLDVDMFELGLRQAADMKLAELPHYLSPDEVDALPVPEVIGNGVIEHDRKVANPDLELIKLDQALERLQLKSGVAQLDAIGARMATLGDANGQRLLGLMEAGAIGSGVAIDAATFADAATSLEGTNSRYIEANDFADLVSLEIAANRAAKDELTFDKDHEAEVEAAQAAWEKGLPTDLATTVPWGYRVVPGSSEAKHVKQVNGKWIYQDNPYVGGHELPAEVSALWDLHAQKEGASAERVRTAQAVSTFQMDHFHVDDEGHHLHGGLLSADPFQGDLSPDNILHNLGAATTRIEDRTAGANEQLMLFGAVDEGLVERLNSDLQEQDFWQEQDNAAELVGHLELAHLQLAAASPNSREAQRIQSRISVLELWARDASKKALEARAGRATSAAGEPVDIGPLTERLNESRDERDALASLPTLTDAQRQQLGLLDMDIRNQEIDLFEATAAQGEQHAAALYGGYGQIFARGHGAGMPPAFTDEDIDLLVSVAAAGGSEFDRSPTHFKVETGGATYYMRRSDGTLVSMVGKDRPGEATLSDGTKVSFDDGEISFALGDDLKVVKREDGRFDVLRKTTTTEDADRNAGLMTTMSTRWVAEPMSQGQQAMWQALSTRVESRAQMNAADAFGDLYKPLVRQDVALPPPRVVFARSVSGQDQQALHTQTMNGLMEMGTMGTPSAAVELQLQNLGQGVLAIYSNEPSVNDSITVETNAAAYAGLMDVAFADAASLGMEQGLEHLELVRTALAEGKAYQGQRAELWHAVTEEAVPTLDPTDTRSAANRDIVASATRAMVGPTAYGSEGASWDTRKALVRATESSQSLVVSRLENAVASAPPELRPYLMAQLAIERLTLAEDRQDRIVAENIKPKDRFDGDRLQTLMNEHPLVFAQDDILRGQSLLGQGSEPIAPGSRADTGAWVEKALGHTKQSVIDQIEAVRGGDGTLTILPIWYSTPQGEQQTILFSVEHDGRTTLVDDNGRRYEDLDDFRSNNLLPAKGSVLVLPADGRNRVGRDGFALLESGDARTQTTFERTRADYHLDEVASVGLLTVGVASMFLTAGSTSALVAAYAMDGLMGYMAVNSVGKAIDMASHGQSIDPTKSWDNAGLWFDIGSSVLGTASMTRSLQLGRGLEANLGAIRNAVEEARRGGASAERLRDLRAVAGIETQALVEGSQAAFRTAKIIGAASEVFDAPSTILGVQQLVSQWDQLTPGQRAYMLAMTAGDVGMATLPVAIEKIAHAATSNVHAPAGGIGMLLDVENIAGASGPPADPEASAVKGAYSWTDTAVFALDRVVDGVNLGGGRRRMRRNAERAIAALPADSPMRTVLNEKGRMLSAKDIIAERNARAAAIIAGDPQLKATYGFLLTGDGDMRTRLTPEQRRKAGALYEAELKAREKAGVDGDHPLDFMFNADANRENDAGDAPIEWRNGLSMEERADYAHRLMQMGHYEGDDAYAWIIDKKGNAELSLLNDVVILESEWLNQDKAPQDKKGVLFGGRGDIVVIDGIAVDRMTAQLMVDNGVLTRSELDSAPRLQLDPGRHLPQGFHVDPATGQVVATGGVLGAAAVAAGGLQATIDVRRDDIVQIAQSAAENHRRTIQRLVANLERIADANESGNPDLALLMRRRAQETQARIEAMPTPEQVAEQTRARLDAGFESAGPEFLARTSDGSARAILDAPAFSFPPAWLPRAWAKPIATLIDKSPTLQAQLRQLGEQGWKIRSATPGTGSFTAADIQTVFMDRELWEIPAGDPAAHPYAMSAEQVIWVLAHEVGHALDATTFEMGSKDLFVEAMLRDEAHANLNEMKVRAEILEAGGPDIFAVGKDGLGANIVALADALATGEMSADEVGDALVGIIGNWEASGVGLPYAAYWADFHDRHMEHPGAAGQGMVPIDPASPQTKGSTGALNARQDLIDGMTALSDAVDVFHRDAAQIASMGMGRLDPVSALVEPKRLAATAVWQAIEAMPGGLSRPDLGAGLVEFLGESALAGLGPLAQAVVRTTLAEVARGSDLQGAWAAVDALDVDGQRPQAPPSKATRPALPLDGLPSTFSLPGSASPELRGALRSGHLSQEGTVYAYLYDSASDFGPDHLLGHYEVHVDGRGLWHGRRSDDPGSGSFDDNHAWVVSDLAPSDSQYRFSQVPQAESEPFKGYRTGDRALRWMMGGSTLGGILIGGLPLIGGWSGVAPRRLQSWLPFGSAIAGIYRSGVTATRSAASVRLDGSSRTLGVVPFQVNGQAISSPSNLANPIELSRVEAWLVQRGFRRGDAAGRGNIVDAIKTVRERTAGLDPKQGAHTLLTDPAAVAARATLIAALRDQRLFDMEQALERYKLPPERHAEATAAIETLRADPHDSEAHRTLYSVSLELASHASDWWTTSGLKIARRFGMSAADQLVIRNALARLDRSPGDLSAVLTLDAADTKLLSSHGRLRNWHDVLQGATLLTSSLSLGSAAYQGKLTPFTWTSGALSLAGYVAQGTEIVGSRWSSARGSLDFGAQPFNKWINVLVRSTTSATFATLAGSDLYNFGASDWRFSSAKLAADVVASGGWAWGGVNEWRRIQTDYLPQRPYLPIAVAAGFTVARGLLSAWAAWEERKAGNAKSFSPVSRATKQPGTEATPVTTPTTPSPAPGSTTPPELDLPATEVIIAKGSPSTSTLLGISAAQVDRLLAPDEQEAARARGGDEEVALEALRRLVELNPEFAFNLDLLDGKVTTSRGDPDRVIPGWVLRLAPQSGGASESAVPL